MGSRFQVLSRASDGGFLWPMARGLARRGIDVTVFSSRGTISKPFVERDGVKTYFLNDKDSSLKNLNFEEACYRKFVELHNQNPFHIVHGLDSGALKIAKNKSKFKVGVAFDVEATQMSQIFSILGRGHETLGSLLQMGVALTYKFLSTYFATDRALINTADGMFVAHPQQRFVLERYYLYPELSIYTLPYGLELSDFKGIDDPNEVKKKWNLPENSQLAVTFSDLNEIQEILHLLSGFEKVAVKKPSSYLLIIGNGPLYKQVEFEILQKALGSRVLLLGAIAEDQALDLVGISDVYINLSSRTTGFETSLIEAMAQKKVIIGSEVSPISHIIEDGVDGFLLRPADRETLSNLLIEIFSGAIPTQELGERARKKVIELFDVKKMTDLAIDAYNQILQKADLMPRQKNASHQQKDLSF
ncbi:MAG: glycosyltransferase family 4 protein [Bdellovibrionales bacterium]